ncbi:PIN domain-containing protein [Pseudomonas viridiflava]|uniref:PIN domain-containing protein n=1 Tax=Pseudomonas viridiflava TaxID=33069 RepID=UPI000F05760C|nr:PIN domain-containing protein [Pseudomonas viridiflava]
MEDSFEFEAILIDTSIFDSNGLRLEKGLLSKLSQFKKSPIDLIFPDVIIGELQAHLIKKIKESRGSLEKAINDAGDHLFLSGESYSNAKALIADSVDIDKLADARIEKFIDAVGGKKLECGKNLDITDLLEKYFANSAPFSESGKKKNEFPDAITLLSVENWAEANGKSVLAISQDGDWRAYCAGSKNITLSDDLSAVLISYNRANPVYALIAKLEASLESQAAKDFITAIENRLESILEDFTPNQDAESAFYWEPDGCSGQFRNFTLNSEQVRLIEKNDEYIVLEMDASITVDVEGEFSLSVHDSTDGDYVPIDSCSVSVEESFDSKLLVTVNGDFSGLTENVELDDLEVEDVEIVSMPTTIHFGTLEPFQDDYD